MLQLLYRYLLTGSPNTRVVTQSAFRARDSADLHLLGRRRSELRRAQARLLLELRELVQEERILPECLALRTCALTGALGA